MVENTSIAWHRSADKHGVSREDALHAIAQHYVYVEKYEGARVPGAHLWVGPPIQPGGALIEVLGLFDPHESDPEALIIFHVMIAKKAHVDLAMRAINGDLGAGVQKGTTS